MKLVYLDSSDFSDLSAPENRIRSEDAKILAALRTAHAEDSAQILLSPPLLSEAVHATAANREDSTRRATLMREFCGTNLLRYPTDICSMEVDCALQNDSVHLTLNDILSSEDEWFGVKFDTSALKETKQDIQRQLDERLQQLPRTQRRKLRSQLDLSKARSRPLIRQMIKENLPKPGTSDDPLLDLIDQELLIGWFLNEKSNADLQQHFCELISDPYILFAHVVDRIGHREQLYSIARSGGDKLSANLQEVGTHLLRLFELSSEFNLTVDPRQMANTLVSVAFLRQIVTGLSNRSTDRLSDAEVKHLVDRCPSLSVLIFALREYIHSILQSNLMRFKAGNYTPTIPKKSDFGDLMHILYAPYVDIFRCDARFGALLKGYPLIRTKIAARRGEILSMLQVN